MKHWRCLRAMAFPALLASLIAAAGVEPGHAATLLGPTGDIVERFTADPRGAGQWHASGSWAWQPRGTTFSSTRPGSLVWTGGGHFTGTLRLRFKLGGKLSRARLVFAHDPATGAQRWVEISAGTPGRIRVGQSGSIGTSAPGVIQAWRVPVAVGAWQLVDLAIAADKSVTVSFNGAKSFTAAAAPIAPGLVGFGSTGGPVTFDLFSFAANPDGEPCRECHAGQAGQPLAADVYAYWDGRWWDANRGGAASVQEGGHGDPGGKAALGCTGTNGCHEMRQPNPRDHRNGVREGRNHQSVNSYHLRTGFIVERPVNPWDAQVAFDNYCTTACHPLAQVPVMTHESDGYPAPGAVQFGQKLTKGDGESQLLPVDSDITQRATTTGPDFAPCISCHDPHGTGSAKVQTTDGTKRSNRMLRADYTLQSSVLCSNSYCHR